MREFINEVLAYRNNFTAIKLGYTDQVKIREAVFEALKVKSMFELRDKFEGEAFFESFSKKIYGVMAVEKCLNIDVINWEQINPKTYIPEIEINGTLYNVLTCGNGNLPLIERINKRPAIITVAMSDEYINICGVASIDILNKYQNDKLAGGLLSRGDKTAFVGFKFLDKLDTI